MLEIPDNIPESQRDRYANSSPAWQKFLAEYWRPVEYKLEDTGHHLVGEEYVRRDFSLNDFENLCLKWRVDRQHVRGNVSISDEVYSKLPGLSSDRQKLEAFRGAETDARFHLWSIFPEPTLPYKHPDFFEHPEGPEKNILNPGIWKDHYLYKLILVHLSQDFSRFAARAGQNDQTWGQHFVARINNLADARYPGR